MTKKNIKIVCGFAVLAFVVLKFFGLELWNALSYAVSAAAVFDFAYDCLLWRFIPFEKTPRLYGTYDCLFISNYNGGTLQSSEVIINQTLSEISISENAKNGSSIAITAELVKNPRFSDPWELYYTYKTHPYDSNGHDDEHHGTAILNVQLLDRLKKTGWRNKIFPLNKADKLIGTYFTNRREPTRGRLIMMRRQNPNIPCPINPKDYLGENE